MKSKYVDAYYISNILALLIYPLYRVFYAHSPKLLLEDTLSMLSYIYANN